MPPPLGAGGIIFSGCPSVRPSVVGLFILRDVRPSVRSLNYLFSSVHWSVAPSHQPWLFCSMSIHRKYLVQTENHTRYKESVSSWLKTSHHQYKINIPPPVLIQLVTRYLVNLLVRIKEPSSPTRWQQSPQLEAEETKKSRKLDCVATGFMYDDAVNFTVDVSPSVWRGFHAFAGEHMEGMVWNFACWCILTIFRIA